MYIDIHRHSSQVGQADMVVRNLFHSQVNEISSVRYASVGLHPWHVQKNTMQEDINKVFEASASDKVIAIGEAGLDKTIDTPLEVQLEAFQRQIDISSQVEKPLIIHCVRAYNEVIKIRKNRGIHQPWIFHWFNASKETAFQLIRSGCYLSFGHMLLNESSKAYKTFTYVPIECVFFETDDAPISIKEVYCKASSMRSIIIAELEAKIELNFTNCFQVSL